MKNYNTLIFYISGPMRGVPEHNYPAFHAAEEGLKRQYPGCTVLNPARNFDGDKTREVNDYLTVDLEMVLKATEIVLLPGWQTSEGARREIEVAKWTGKAFWLATLYDGNPDFAPGSWRFELLSEPPVLEESPRASALDEARQLITGDRNNQYGPPTQDFTRTAGMANAFGFRVNGKELKGHDVAIFMMMLKTSRLAWTPGKRDSWVDSAGYAGCGYECAVEEAEADKAQRGMTRPEMESALARWVKARMNNAPAAIVTGNPQLNLTPREVDQLEEAKDEQGRPDSLCKCLRYIRDKYGTKTEGFLPRTDWDKVEIVVTDNPQLPLEESCRD